ncbi:MAG: trimeric intracellular cation channel family protein [Sciscionella sp.]
MLLTILNLVGTAAFAASGALAAVRAKLDVFGVIVLGLTTALGGGIMRDLLIGITPPTTLRTWPYLAVAAAASLVVFWFPPHVQRLRRLVALADAVGLAVFVTAGTATALSHGVPWYSSCLIGMTTGIGGGALRDILVREIPAVLRKEIYALAALAGALVVVLGHWWIAGPGWAFTIAGSVLIVVIRILAIWRKWNAPVPKRAL